MSQDTSTDAEGEVEALVLAALRQRAEARSSSEQDDEALIESALAAHFQAEEPQAEEPEESSNKIPWMVATTLLAAAAAAALWVFPANEDVVHEATNPRATNPVPTQAMWVLEDQGTPIEGVVVAAPDGAACGIRTGARACLSPGSRAAFEANGNVVLHTGEARIEAREAIVVSLAGVGVRTKAERATFSATVHEREWSVAVDTGDVIVTRPEAMDRVLAGGESMASSKPSAEPAEDGGDEPSPESTDTGPEATATTSNQPKPSADELLAQARASRAEGKFSAAAHSYEQLIRAYPNSAKARSALVSLAQLYQGPLDQPAKALRTYERYLERGGPLAEEAHYGKIRALRSLGRGDAAKTATQAFLDTYPNSIHADALKGD